MSSAYIKQIQQFLSQNRGQIHDAVLAVTIVASLTWVLYIALQALKSRYQQSTTKPRASTPDVEKNKRKYGEWTPSSFKRPEPKPYENWDVKTTKPLLYRPFRYGPGGNRKYFVTMGLRNMKWDEWIELDNHYPRYHADKARRIKERASKCCRTAPEAMDGAIELLEELASYLPARYPTLYRATPVGLDNLLTGESFNIVQRPLAEDPMITSARLVQDDLALMVEKPDGQYYLLAGAILLPGFWRLEDKFGMALSEIHTSGDVPQYKEKLEKGMMNFFRRLKPEGPVLRNNYFLQVDDQLAWSPSIGSEDEPGISWNTAQKNRAIEHHYFRSERQSLRRLPRSGVVVFTIRTYFEPITEIAKEPYVPGRLASAIRSWEDDVSIYKGKEKYGEVLLEYLDKQHEEQIANGLDLEKEDGTKIKPAQAFPSQPWTTSSASSQIHIPSIYANRIPLENRISDTSMHQTPQPLAARGYLATNSIGRMYTTSDLKDRTEMSGYRVRRAHHLPMSL
uniref:Alanine/arginine aminopeptidase n=1 Tax=Talaromyces marneffei PM1 TaxID=1077442 RepID=A0A093XI47_TALMA